MHALSTVLISLLGTGSIAGGSSQPPAKSAGAIEDSSWYAQVILDIRHGEYAYRSAGAVESPTWSAPNRSQELRSRVSQTGLEVFPRSVDADAATAPWRLALSTTSFGRAGSLRDLGCAALAAQGNRVELDHEGLLEWFENGREGIEQGWTIGARPRGAGPVWIGLGIGGDLYLRIEDGARSGVLVDAQGTVRMRYRDLLVLDATGRELEAQLVPSPSGGGGVGIEIDDAEAVYPLTVDPVLTGPAWTAENNQIDSQFGATVAPAGDVNGDGYSDVVVSAYLYDNGQLDEGRAYAYMGSATGLATSPAWTKEGNQINAKFGFAIGTAGDVNGDGFSDVIVGAHGFDNGESDEGRVFVYLGSASGLAASPVWTAESNQQDAFFGRAAATAGDVNGDGFSDVIVGAYLYHDGEAGEGRAYVYFGSPSGPSASPDWTAEGNQTNAFFGLSVASAGDINGDGYADVLVGADAYDGAETDGGRVFAFFGSPTGPSLVPDWTADGDQGGSLLGYSVATAGDVNGDGFSDVIVGASLYDGPQVDEGRAFVFYGSASGLSIAPDWTTESNQTGANYGYSVSMAGDVNGDGYGDVIVGARAIDNGQTDEGRVYVYLGSASGLSTSPSWTEESGQPGAFYGTSVATAGDVNGDGYSDVIVGSNAYDNGSENEGKAFAYMGSAVGLTAGPVWAAESDQASAAFGFSVSTAGDVNGDGYSDVIVGAPLFDGGETDEGRVYGFLGSPAGLPAIPDWTVESDQAGASFGYSVATAGDVNGDGYGDVIVGAPFYDNGETDEGRAFVYLGSASGLSATPAWTAESDQAGAEFGNSVSTAGDVDGDSFCDVIVGARSFDNGQVNEGRAFAYLGSASGLASVPVWTTEGDQANAAFATSVSTAGDVNGDGFSDLIVGAPLLDNGQTNEGRAYAYLGSTTGPSTLPVWLAESNNVGASFGFSVSTAGDVNGDGLSDVIVGAYLLDNGETDEGRAYVYLGNVGGINTIPSWTAESNQPIAYFGFSVSTAGDVNGDGYSDVIVGARAYDNPEADEGRAYVYLGSASGLATSPAWTVESNQASASLGLSVSTAGDVNGDGYSDVIVGAPDYDNAETDEGRALLFLGNEGKGGWTLAAQQRQLDDALPIALLGKSSSPTMFRILLGLEHGTAGFDWASPVDPKARLQWKVAALGRSLNSTSYETGPEQTITGSPLLFDEIVEFPAGSSSRVHKIPVGPHHWRARVRTNNALFPVTPWVSMPGNNETESKLWARRIPAIEPR